MKPDKIKRMLDACYLAKRIRELLPELPDGVAPAYIQYIDVIHHLLETNDCVKISDISDWLNLPRPGVTRTVKEMEAKGYLNKGQYGHVKIRLEPNESGKGYEFINEVVGGAVPKEYIPAVDAGIQGAMLSGVLAGYPVVDVKVTLYDGSYHEVDSSEMAFKIAGSMAFKEACQKADPTLLEPIMKVCVIVPEEYMGDVIGDLNSRRGQIQGFEARSGAQQIDAFVPLSEMFGYATDLRSRTQGRGQYTMEPSHYVEIPKNIRDKIIDQRMGARAMK